MPADPRALAARCGYCHAETALPAHVIAARRAELAEADRQRRAAEGQAAVKTLVGGVLISTIVAIVVPLVIVVVVLVGVGVALFMTLPR